MSLDLSMLLPGAFIPSSGPATLRPDLATSATFLAWWDGSQEVYLADLVTPASLGQEVTSWRARAYNAGVLNASSSRMSATNKPTYTADGLLFNGTSNAMGTAGGNVVYRKFHNGNCTVIIRGIATNLNSGVGMFLVGNTTVYSAGTGGIVVLDDISPANQRVRYFARTNADGVVKDFESQDNAVAASPFVVSIRVTPSAGNDARIRVGGVDVSLTANADATLTDPFPVTAVGLRLSQNATPYSYFGGSIRHLVIYDGILSDSELAAVEAYLAA